MGKTIDNGEGLHSDVEGHTLFSFIVLIVDLGQSYSVRPVIRTWYV